MSAYSDAVLADSPVSYWRLDETSGTNANDSGSNNLDGTYTGGYTLNQASLLLTDADASVALDGVAGSYVTVPDNNLLDLGDGPFTLECWVQRSDTTACGLISKTGANGYRLSIGTGADLGKIVLSRATTIVAITGVLVNDTRGHHIVATRGAAGATTNLYVDGVDVTPSITAGAFANTANQLLLGAQTTTLLPLNGRLDEVAIYASVLTATQVQNHYLLGRAIGVGQATETDTAQAITFASGAQVGQALETDTANAVTPRKTVAVAQATETDTAQAIVFASGAVVTQTTETDTAQAVTSAKVKAIGQATETDSAQTVSSVHSAAVGQASETDAAQAVTALKTVAVGQAGETDLAQTVTQAGVVGQALETNVALPITVQMGAAVSDGGGWAMPVKLPRKHQFLPVLGVQERDTALPIGVVQGLPPRLRYIPRVKESNVALPIGAVQTPSLIQIEDDELLLIL